MSFVKVILDDNSLEFFCENYNRITDPLARLLILRSIYDMVLDARINLKKFVSLVSTVFEFEGNVGKDY